MLYPTICGVVAFGNPLAVILPVTIKLPEELILPDAVKFVVVIAPFAVNNPPIVPAPLIESVWPINPAEELILPLAVMFVVLIAPSADNLPVRVDVPVILKLPDADTPPLAVILCKWACEPDTITFFHDAILVFHICTI